MNQSRRQRLWTLLNALSFVRPGATQAEYQAADILMECTNALGLRAIREPFPVDFFQAEQVSLCMETGMLDIPCKAANFSGTTSPQGITAPFAYVGDAAVPQLTDACGKIVLCHEALTVERWQNLINAKVAAVIVCSGTVMDNMDLAELCPPVLREAHRACGSLPVVVVHMRDAVALTQAQPTRLHLRLSASVQERRSQNIAVELPGTVKPDQLIVCTAHYDSTANSPGACDNAAGSAVLMELAHHFSRYLPARTMRFVWMGAEESGLLGSRAYIKTHSAELVHMRLAVNIDMGGAAIGTNKVIVTAASQLLSVARSLADDTGYLADISQDTYSSDSIPFADCGIPSINFARIAAAGALLVHTQCDSPEFLSSEPLEEMASFCILFCEHVAKAECFPVERIIPPAVQDMLAAYHKRKPY